MKILVLGSGGVGAYYGAKLVQAGQDVHFVTRGKNLEAFLHRGIQVKSFQGDFSVSTVSASEAIPDESFDLVILAVKSYDTERLIPQMQAVMQKSKTLLSLQNGVENEEMLRRAFGEEKVIGGICYIGSELKSPGQVEHLAKGGIACGEFSGILSDRVKEIQHTFESSGIECKLSNDIDKLLWTKFLWNVGFNPLCTLLQTHVSPLLTRPDLRNLVISAMSEAVQVGQKCGVKITEKEIQMNMSVSDRELHDVRPSMLQDFEKGKKLEHETFCGYLVRKSNDLGLLLPINAFLYASLNFLDSKRL